MDGVKVKRTFQPVPDFQRDADGNLVRFEHPVDNQNAREQRVREDFIAMEKLDILRKRVKLCYYEETVNHLDNCRDIAKEYYTLLKKPRYGALYTKTEN